MSPLRSGAPDAPAIPRQRGTATRNTTSPAERSFFTLLRGVGIGSGFDEVASDGGVDIDSTLMRILTKYKGAV
jgi:hypothetical protein